MNDSKLQRLNLEKFNERVIYSDFICWCISSTSRKLKKIITTFGYGKKVKKYHFQSSAEAIWECISEGVEKIL